MHEKGKRRRRGEYFTPLFYSKKALDYIEKVKGPDWQSRCKIWDMACGTANLEYYLPSSNGTYDNLFLSTIDPGEVLHLNNNNMFPGATIFEYDYLNDDIDLVMSLKDLSVEDRKKKLLDSKQGWKLPIQLRTALADENNEWVILINPPFCEVTAGVNKGVNKKNVEQTKVREYMEGKGNARELFIQFFFRIFEEVENVTLGMFSKIKHLNGPNLETFRNTILKADFSGGFLFPSTTFEGVTEEWPVGFLVWKKGQNVFGNGTVTVDVYENETLTGTKIIKAVSEDGLLNAWIGKKDKPKRTLDTFAVTSALKVLGPEKMAPGQIAALASPVNDMQNQRGVFLVSSYYRSEKNTFAVDANNYEKAMATFTARLIVEKDWLKDRDQFLKPSAMPPADFINDCIVWTMFHDSNQTSSFNAEYKGKVKPIRNGFFPFLRSELNFPSFEQSNQSRAEQDTWVAIDLKERILSVEAQAVLDAGRKVYQVFFDNWDKLKGIEKNKYKLEFWDVGWYQVNSSLKAAGLGLNERTALERALVNLTNRLAPQIVPLGFLS